MQLGMIGLGGMGSYMVQRLLKAGQNCVVYDSHPQAMHALVDKGAQPSSSVADLLRNSRDLARSG